MEEVLAHDERSESDDDDESPFESSGSSQRVSPRASQRSEVVDALTLECFASTVVPLVGTASALLGRLPHSRSLMRRMDIQMTSFVQTLFQTHQTMLRAEREHVETAARRAVEDHIAAEQAAREYEVRQAIEAAERAAALARAAEQEAREEAARQEQLRQQQREENDDEEIKIRTLAYSHTREWYQPNKKCFSHRGRQLYVLKASVCIRRTLETVDWTHFSVCLHAQDVLEASARSQSTSVDVPLSHTRCFATTHQLTQSLARRTKASAVRRHCRHERQWCRTSPRAGRSRRRKRAAPCAFASSSSSSRRDQRVDRSRRRLVRSSAGVCRQ